MPPAKLVLVGRFVLGREYWTILEIVTDISASSETLSARPAFDRGPVLFIGVALALALCVVGLAVDPRQAWLLLIGALLGVALYHGSFGFTGGWRRFAVERRGQAIRAQLLMIAVASLVFIPLLDGGSAFGRPLIGALAPVGVSVLLGAGLFGFGMQLGGACGSGTLYTVGGGNARMLVTLAFFIIGALIGSAHLPFWLELPAFPATSIAAFAGPVGGVIATLGVLGAVAGLTVFIERRAHGDLGKMRRVQGPILDTLVRGPWPVVWAALMLAALNIITLVTAGHPWSITFGFGLWGAKVAQAIGVPVETWTFWTWPGPAKGLAQSVLADVTSVMNIGILFGAALAASLAGRFAQRVHVPMVSLVAAAIGGILMGYGARLSFGCNIGALFSGIASGSLHGWVWFGAAYCGSLAGIAVRPAFGLDGYRTS